MASSLRDEISRLELLHAAHPDGLVFPHLADAYRRAGRYAQAENLLHAGLRRHAEYSSAHVVLGRLRLDQGKRQEAETAFRRVLQLDPHNHVALEYLAEIAAGQGRLKEALGLYRRLARIKTDDALVDRVEALERQLARGGGVTANGHTTPSGASLGNGGGTAAEGRGVARESGGSPRAEGRAPVSAAPEPGEVVTETMAELYARQGLHHRAVAVYRQLLQRTPGDSRLRGKLQEAEAALQAAAGEGPRGEAPTRAIAQATESRPPEPRPRARTETRPRRRLEPAPRPAPRPPRSDEAVRGAAGPAAGPRPTEGPTVGRGPSIGDELRGILAWKPEPAERKRREPEQAPAGARERWTERSLRAPPSGAVPDEGETGRSARPGNPLAAASPQTRSLIALTDMLVGLLEYRDPFFRGSSSLTRLLALSVAEEMGLSTEDRVDLALAAVLRDLGRLALGGKLVTTARVTTSQEARRKIERHVDLALHLMEGIELPRSVRLAVRHHHERWDGAGYPDALAAEDIPVLARILAVVDSFAAMVSPRPYRLPRKVPEAAAELQRESGTQYDPDVVNALVRVLARREQPHLGFVQRHHILMVNPDQPGAVVSAAKLCSGGYLAEVAVDPATARERLRRVPVAALVVSAECGADATAALIRELRVDPLFSSLPIVVSDAAGVGLRVRLLESGADVCFPPGVRHAELQGTIGALVRRTLSPRHTGEGGRSGPESPWLALQGDIQDFPLTWLLQVMKYDSRTAAIGIRGADGEGVIYLRKGDAVHAQVRGGPGGEPALRQMLHWGKGRFTVQPDARPKEQTITTSIMHLLLTQAVDQDHAAAGIFGAVSAGG